MNKKKLFLAAPISGFGNECEYQKYRKDILDLISFLRNNSIDVYSEVETISGESNYDSPGQSAIEDFKRINESHVFLLLHLRKLQTSTLIELGYAYAKGKAIIIVGTKSTLPYLALGLPSVDEHTTIIDSVNLDATTFAKILRVLAV